MTIYVKKLDDGSYVSLGRHWHDTPDGPPFSFIVLSISVGVPSVAVLLLSVTTEDRTREPGRFSEYRNTPLLLLTGRIAPVPQPSVRTCPATPSFVPSQSSQFRTSGAPYKSATASCLRHCR